MTGFSQAFDITTGVADHPRQQPTKTHPRR
jgi:hypothetical protein